MEERLSKSLNVLTALLTAVLGVFMGYELWKFLTFDIPLNHYEPELVTEAWALSQGQFTHPPYERGPNSGLYAPLYQVFASVFFRVLEPSLLFMRFISFLSVAGISFLAFRFSESGNKREVVIWFGLIFMWHNFLIAFDLQGKPDSFGVFLAFTAVYLVSQALKTGTFIPLIFSGVVSALAVSAKQPMLFVAVAAVLALLIHKEFKKAAIWMVSFGGFSLFLWPVLAWICGPMLFKNVFVVPGYYPIRFGVLGNAMHSALLYPFVIVALIALVFRVQAREWQKTDTLLLMVWLLSFPASLLTAAKAGGMNNALQPFWYTNILILARNSRLMLRVVNEHCSRLSRSILMFSAVLAVYATFTFNIPSEWTRIGEIRTASARYEAIAKELRQEQGSVFVPMDNYLGIKAGKPVNFSYKSELDVFPAYRFRQEPRNVHREALKRDLVLLHRYNGWFQPDKFEIFLRENGFQEEKTVPLDSYVSITFWRKSKAS